jgi:signal transduction histidine kinase
MTDQELSARVEELSVMQRIDRELNASLDVGRAMRITLDWALRQSGAEAGFIGVLIEDDTRLRIMAQDGYGEALAEYENAPMDIEQESLKLAIESGQPQKLLLDSSRQDLGYLATVRTQIVVPIKRETKVIGLFVLESSRELDDSVLEFLIRLSDHAAIAIANAQLFEAVERANAAKTEFISFVAHELKNPMTSIKGYTDLLAKGAVGPINEMQANFLKTISTNVERMSRLVSDLNDNSKIEAGRLHLDFSRVDINDIIEDAVRSLSQQMQEKEQTIEVQAPDNLPPVWADKTRISQVLVNLVSNAYKYTPRGGHIIVGAEVSENIWDPEGAEQVVHLWVKDNGIGIKPEDQKKIFQKFFRSDDEKARESPGTGLGLNITKGLVELQGGKIWFESEFRKGTTFHFTVPVATEKEA